RRFSVGELDDPEHVVRARVLNADAPCAVAARPEDAKIAAGVDERGRDAVPAEELDDAIDGRALRDAAEVEQHGRPRRALDAVDVDGRDARAGAEPRV